MDKVQEFTLSTPFDLSNVTHEGGHDISDKLTQIGDVSFSACLLYTSPSPRDKRQSRMPSSA